MALTETEHRYRVETFGLDCLGNCTGWVVYDRADRRVVETFVGNIYEPEQRRAAKADAYALAGRLNREAGR